MFLMSGVSEMVMSGVLVSPSTLCMSWHFIICVGGTFIYEIVVNATMLPRNQHQRYVFCGVVSVIDSIVEFRLIGSFGVSQ